MCEVCTEDLVTRGITVQGFGFLLPHYNLYMPTFKRVVKVMVSSYIAQYPSLIAQTIHTLLPDRPVQSSTISGSLGSIQPRRN